MAATTTDECLIDRIPEVLSWRTAPSILERAVDRHAALLAEALQDLLAETPPALPEEAFARLARAPESCRRLLYDSAPNIEFFNRSTAAEHRRLGVPDVIPDQGVWTALGDRWFPGAEEPEKAYAAPVLSNGVVVDFFSPHAARLLRAYGHSLSSPHPVDTRGVVGKLEEALGVLAEVSPEAAGFFRSFVQVVIPWDHPGGPHKRSSFSDTRWVGALGCANALTVGELHLAEMLLHESVHSYLGIVEEQVPIIGNLEAVRGMRVPSPWTGTPLHPRNFFHACFVWFALMQFWRVASDRGTVDGTGADQLMDRAGSGFRSPVLLDALAEAGPHLSTPVRDSIPAFLSDVSAGRYA